MDNQFKRAQTDQTNKEPFKTPDQVAAKDSEPAASPFVVSNHQEKSDSIMKKMFAKVWPPNKYTWIGLAVLVLLAGGLSYWLTRDSMPAKTAAPIIAHKAPAKPNWVASSLTGLPTGIDTNKLPITAVMIENSPDARPQSGLGEAGVVFEAVAEGGVTRFVALYQSNDSTSIGPVRSARPYYISWMLGFDAAYAHVGGSPDALSDIPAWSVKDMNEFYNAGTFQRVSSRAAPHNVYTTLSQLYQLEKAKGYTTSTFTSWPRKASQPLKTPTARNIGITLSGPIYNVNYTYNSKTNSYDRLVGGATHVDQDNNKQLSPNVVIAIVVQESAGALDSSGAYYSNYTTIGNGTAYVFQDGGVTVGQWTKDSNNGQITFTTSSGQAIPLNPGQTWITAITSTSHVGYN